MLAECENVPTNNDDLPSTWQSWPNFRGFAQLSTGQAADWWLCIRMGIVVVGRGVRSSDDAGVAAHGGFNASREGRFGGVRYCFSLRVF